jgi:uncharacterized protein with FMN-binding domain
LESSGPSRKAIISLVVVVLLVIAATGTVIATNGNKDSTNSTVASTSPSTQVSDSPTPSTSATSTSSSASSFKDGTYSAAGSYNSPGGTESIDVSVTLANGTITATSLTKHPNDGDAEEYQTQFEQNYKTLVVGKKITDVNLSRVAGSSLTSNGFNSAIDQIKQKAEA